MKPRTFWTLIVLPLGAILIAGAIWWHSPPPALPPMPPEVKAKETKATPPVPVPYSPVPAVPPVPSDPLLRRWQASVLKRDEKGVIAAQTEFLRREGEYREPLMAMAKEDPEPRVRAFCVAVLGRMQTPPPEEFFLGRLADAHEYPRTSALQALEKAGTARSLPEFDRLAASDPSDAVRAAASQAAKVVRSR